MKKIYKTICSKDKLADIRKFISRQISSLNLSETEREKIILAVDEASANAMIHGNQCDSAKDLHIEFILEPDSFRVEIYDVGKIDFKKPRVVDLEEIVKNRQRGGLGMYLMHLIMDEVDYYMRGDTNVCSLKKQISPSI